MCAELIALNDDLKEHKRTGLADLDLERIDHALKVTEDAAQIPLLVNQARDLRSLMTEDGWIDMGTALRLSLQEEDPSDNAGGGSINAEEGRPVLPGAYLSSWPYMYVIGALIITAAGMRQLM